jgi:hypothetical protein
LVKSLEWGACDLRAALPTLGMVQPRDAMGKRYRYYQGVDLAYA